MRARALLGLGLAFHMGACVPAAMQPRPVDIGQRTDTAAIGLADGSAGARWGVDASDAELDADPRLAPSVRTMPRSAARDIESVGLYLRSREPDPLRRLKAIHDFIADRIAYDAAAWDSGIIPPADAEPDEVLRRRLAVCEGYARLLAAIAAVTGDPVRVVEGEAISPDGTRQPHAWNEAWLGDRWAPIDVTWDAGYVDDAGFHKRYRTAYFLASDGAFSRNHFHVRSDDCAPTNPPVEVVAQGDPRLEGGFFAVLRDDQGCATKMIVLAPPDGGSAVAPP